MFCYSIVLLIYNSTYTKKQKKRKIHFSFSQQRPKMQTTIRLILLSFCVGVLIQTARSTCEEDWECSSVSLNYNYVKCLDNVCSCRKDLGFKGNATSVYPCSCPFPKRVYWKDNLPWCIDYQDAVFIELENYREAVLKAKIYSLYTQIIASFEDPTSDDLGGLRDYFAPEVIGFFAPFGVFSTREQLLDYYGALVGDLIHPNRMYLKHYLAEKNHVVAFIDLEFEKGPLDGKGPEYANITQHVVYEFNIENQIIGVHSMLLASGKALDLDESKERILQSTCSRLISQCNQTHDPDGYFTTIDECVDFLYELKFGTYDYPQSNSVICRHLYSLLVSRNPKSYCRNAGRTGGSVCIDEQ